MSLYAWKGLDAGGKTVGGTRDADGAKALRQALRRDGVFMTDLSEVLGSSPKSKSASAPVTSGGPARSLFRRDVNVAWDLATHDISIILMLLGEMPIEVTCQGESHYHDHVEDVALLTLRFANNVIAFVHVSWLDPNKIRRTTIVGSRKMLVYDDTALQEKVRVYDKGVTKQPYYDTYGDFQLSYRYGDVNIPRIEDSEPLKVECDHFVDCITRDVSPNSDGYSGLRVVKVLEAADRSLKNHGQPIAIAPSKLI